MSRTVFSMAIEIVTVIFEVIIISVYFNAFLQVKHRKKTLAGTIVYIAATCMIAAVSLFFPDPLILISVTSSAMFLIGTRFEGPLRTKLLFIILFDAFIVIVDFVTIYVLYLLNGLTFIDTTETVLYRILGIIVSKLLVFLLVKQTYLWRKRVIGKLPFSSSLILSILPISSIIVIFQLVVNSQLNHASSDSSIIVLIEVVSLFASNIAVFGIFEQQMEAQNERERMRITEQQILHQTAYYKDMVEQQGEVREIRHDLKNCLSSLASYLRVNDFQQVAEYSKKIDKMADSLKMQVNTGYQALDIIFWGKVRLAEHCGVNFSYSLFMPEDMRVDEMDLCIILANALDNAIEACKKIEEPGRRKISLVLKTEGDYISIYIENSTGKKVIVPEGGLVKTTKEDAKNHGFGLQSIKNLAEKYNGDMAVSSDEQIFMLSVLLKNA
ncbi:MAG TPA: hypothetical protein DEQ02_10040 [Ruminococcaceae bacterium]|nr:hypothetical protein [Oscillospiraceae bacterium]